MSLEDEDKLTRRGFVAGLIAAGVAKGLALPPGLENGTQAAAWTGAGDNPALVRRFVVTFVATGDPEKPYTVWRGAAPDAA